MVAIGLVHTHPKLQRCLVNCKFPNRTQPITKWRPPRSTIIGRSFNEGRVNPLEVEILLKTVTPMQREGGGMGGVGLRLGASSQLL